MDFPTGRIDAMTDAQPLFAELEAALTQTSGSLRFSILRKVTDLFLANADSYSDDHVAVFDQLMRRLIETIERQALIELSRKLALVERAPVNVINQLSHDDDIDVSGPVLKASNVLGDDALVEIAQTKSQAHLAAIADRPRIDEPVTDVLIDRGNAHVARKVTANEGARFSRTGLAKAVMRAASDEILAIAVANRIDLPADLLEQLVRKATATVRRRLLATARPDMHDKIVQVLSTVSGRVGRSIAPAEVKNGVPTMVREAPERIRARISQCVEARDLDGLLDALAALSEIPLRAVKDVVRQASDEGMLVIGRACGMAWPELHEIMTVTMPDKIKSSEETRSVCTKYVNLSAANARRAVRFIRASSEKSADELRKFI